MLEEDSPSPYMPAWSGLRFATALRLGEVLHIAKGGRGLSRGYETPGDSEHACLFAVPQVKFILSSVLS